MSNFEEYKREKMEQLFKQPSVQEQLENANDSFNSLMREFLKVKKQRDELLKFVKTIESCLDIPQLQEILNELRLLEEIDRLSKIYQLKE